MDPSSSSNHVFESVEPLAEKTTAMAVLNGNLTNGFHEPTQEELERELPMVYDDQVPLGDALSRVVQAIYAELCELAETCVSSFTSENLSLMVFLQHAQHVGCHSQAHTRGLGRQNQEAGCEALRRGKMGPRCGYCAKMHGTVLPMSSSLHLPDLRRISPLFLWLKINNSRMLSMP